MFDAFGRTFHLHHRTSWPGTLGIYSGGGTGSLIQTYDMEREGPWPHWLVACFPGQFLTQRTRPPMCRPSLTRRRARVNPGIPSSESKGSEDE